MAVNNKQPVCVGLFLASKMTCGFILGEMIRVTVGSQFPVWSPLHEVPVGGLMDLLCCDHLLAAIFYGISVDLRR